MEFRESVLKLNNVDENRLKYILDNIEQDPKDSLLDESFGLMFGLLKKIDYEELYVLACFQDGILEKISDELLPHKNIDDGRKLIKLFTNPIQPFQKFNMDGERYVNLLTFRKKEDNPKAILLSGPGEESNIFGIISNEGLSESGMRAYKEICSAALKLLDDEKISKVLINYLVKSLTSERRCFYTCGQKNETVIFTEYDVLLSYYDCTSVIYCELKDINEESVRIQPLKHNICTLQKGTSIEYDDFGEIGSFVFNLSDYY